MQIEQVTEDQNLIDSEVLYTEILAAQAAIEVCKDVEGEGWKYSEETKRKLSITSRRAIDIIHNNIKLIHATI